MESLEISINSLLLVEEKELVKLGKGRKAWKNVIHKSLESSPSNWRQG